MTNRKRTTMHHASIPVTNYDDVPLQHERRLQDRWHFGKEIPIALIIAVGMQTVGGIWWMAQLSTKLDNAVATINEFKTERYTREDARRDRVVLDQQFENALNRDREMERRVNAIENRLDRVSPPK